MTTDVLATQKTNKLKRGLIQGVASVLIIGLGFAASKRIGAPTAPNRAEQAELALLVGTVTAERATHELAIEASGQLTAAEQVVLAPEVQGRVRWVSEHLVPGGRVRRGEALLRIDARDFELAYASQSAEVRRARLELELEESRREIAVREWAAFSGAEAAHGDAGPEGLNLRGPQLETAQVSVRAAESAVSRAQLNLSRTTLTAPFNAVVSSKNVEVGAIVGPQSQTATLIGTDAFWVRVSVPVGALSSLVPRSATNDGTLAMVRSRVTDTITEREGRVINLLPDVDAIGGMARVLVEIADPLSVTDNAGPPLLLGSFVEVSMTAAPVADAIELPRAALRDGSRIFALDAESKLVIHPVTVLASRTDTVIVRSDIANGTRVITTRVPLAVAGTQLRTADVEASVHE